LLPPSSHVSLAGPSQRAWLEPSRRSNTRPNPPRLAGSRTLVGIGGALDAVRCRFVDNAGGIRANGATVCVTTMEMTGTGPLSTFRSEGAAGRLEVRDSSSAAVSTTGAASHEPCRPAQEPLLRLHEPELRVDSGL